MEILNDQIEIERGELHRAEENGNQGQTESCALCPGSMIGEVQRGGRLSLSPGDTHTHTHTQTHTHTHTHTHTLLYFYTVRYSCVIL